MLNYGVLRLVLTTSSTEGGWRWRSEVLDKSKPERVWVTNLSCGGAKVPAQVNKLKWPQPRRRLYSREKGNLNHPKRSVRLSTLGKPLTSVLISHHTTVLPSSGGWGGVGEDSSVKKDEPIMSEVHSEHWCLLTFLRVWTRSGTQSAS